MARKTLRDQLRESAKSATSIGAEHRAIVRELEANASASQQECLPPLPPSAAEILHLPSQKSSLTGESKTENRTTQPDKINGQDKRTTQTDRMKGQDENLPLLLTSRS